MFICSCSVDPYLFENFNTIDGDFLTAKFRAFKFPDSTYVQFRGTVNACVDKCKGIQCSNGQIGYGRKKREIAQSPDPNKIYEISMTTFIRVVGDPVGVDKSKYFVVLVPTILSRCFVILTIFRHYSIIVTVSELEQKLEQLKLANQKLQRNSRGSVFEGVHDNKALIRRANGGDSAAIVEETTLIRAHNPNSATTSNPFRILSIIALGVLTFKLF